MSQPFTMTVRYDSGILHFSLMGNGKRDYRTKSKCFEVEDSIPFSLCSTHETQMDNKCHIHINIDSHALIERSGKTKEHVNSK